MKILDLTLSPLSFVYPYPHKGGQNIYRGNEFADNPELSEVFQKFITTWPLSISCGIKVTDPNERQRKFKEEYIIPQLILQSLVNNGIDGVAYLSTSIKDNFNGKPYSECCETIFVNYAFPAKGDDDSLKNNFVISNPMNLCDVSRSDSILEKRVALIRKESLLDECGS